MIRLFNFLRRYFTKTTKGNNHLLTSEQYLGGYPSHFQIVRQNQISTQRAVKSATGQATCKPVSSARRQRRFVLLAYLHKLHISSWLKWRFYRRCSKSKGGWFCNRRSFWCCFHLLHFAAAVPIYGNYYCGQTRVDTVI